MFFLTIVTEKATVLEYYDEPSNVIDCFVQFPTINEWTKNTKDAPLQISERVLARMPPARLSSEVYVIRIAD